MREPVAGESANDTITMNVRNNTAEQQQVVSENVVSKRKQSSDNCGVGNKVETQKSICVVHPAK